MLGIKKINPMVRAVGTMAAVVALVGGVTFAALTSNNVTLADSEFSTGTASLKIWDSGTSTYVTSTTGFSLNDLALDTESSQYTFWLKNDGTASLNIKGLGTIAGYTGFTDFAKVHFHVTNITTANSLDYTFADLLDGTPDALPGNPLDAGEENQYGLTIKIDNDAVNASSASVSDFDWVFTGTNP